MNKSSFFQILIDSACKLKGYVCSISGHGYVKEFKSRPVRKLVALFMLSAFFFNGLAEVVVDPVGLGNARATVTATGIDQLDISTPNANGTSYNSLMELQVGERGLILNNNRHIVADTQLAGLVARNRNLDNGVEANLIITEISGKNRTAINGHVEVAGRGADLVIANRNGIMVNGGGFLNTDRVTLTTGRLVMDGGDLKSIDVEAELNITEEAFIQRTSI